jgi:UDP-N-acetylbacillosamine N-acetyltransferase
MPEKRLIIWGASGHALVVADIIRLSGEYRICGFIDDYNPVETGAAFQGVPIFSDRNCLEHLKSEGLTHAIVGIGDCKVRLSLANWLRSSGLSLAKAIHPKAVVASGVEIGDGSVIAAGAVVNPGVTIGENVIVNTCASVDHECELADGAHICPGSHLAGRVKVGRAAWVGIGSSVKDRITIGEGAMIGAGAVVVHDIPDGMLAYGVPARVIRQL